MMETKLSPEVSEFVLRWGEAGRAWGLPRSATQVHGLLLAADHPLTAEEICAALSIARSNVSTSLRELRSIGVVRSAEASTTGGRAERFEALDDPYEAAARIVAARKAREFDPAAATLRDGARRVGGAAGARLAAYADLAEATGGWAEDVSRLPRRPLKALLAAGATIADLIAPQKSPAKKKKKKK